MFKGVGNIFKSYKGVAVDSQSHLTIKNTDLNLVLLRPYDLVYLGELVGRGSEDILILVGKTIGKRICVEIEKRDNIKKLEKKYQTVLDTFMTMGFGKFNFKFDEFKSATIKVKDPISNTIKDKNEARVLCNLYNGLFLGMLSQDSDAEGIEKQCILNSTAEKTYDECIFEYKLSRRVDDE
jgi:hypothetical protein